MATMKTKGSLAPLAQAFETALERFGELSRELGSNEITTQKSLVRAKKTLEDAAACEGEMAEHVAALAQAMKTAGELQQAYAQATIDAAERIQTRSTDLGSLMERFAKLGENARSIHEPFAKAVAARDEDTTADAMRTSLQELVSKMEAVVAEANALTESAKEGKWEDVARDADSLRQQVQSARNKALQGLRKASETSAS